MAKIRNQKEVGALHDYLRDEMDDTWMMIENDLTMPDKVLPDPGLLDYYRLLRHRSLFITDAVEYYSEPVVKQIMLWNLEDMGKTVTSRRPIVLYILSNGGSIDDMWMLIDVIEASQTPVVTVDLGMAASAAGMVFLAGSKRVMLKHAKVMLHEGSAVLRGDANKLFDAAEDYSRDVRRSQEFVLDHTKIPEDVLEKHKKDDWYVDAELCLKYGICDQVVDSLDQILKGKSA